MLAQEHTTHGEIDLCTCGNLVYEVDSTKLKRESVAYLGVLKLPHFIKKHKFRLFH